MPGIGEGWRQAARRARTHPVFAKAASANSTLPICAIRTATNYAGSTGPNNDRAVSFEIVSENKSHGGRQLVVRHASSATSTEMTFSIFLPPQAEQGGKLPIIWYLSGLTCTHANVTEKGEYRAACAEHGLIFVAPARTLTVGAGCRIQREDAMLLHFPQLADRQVHRDAEEPRVRPGLSAEALDLHERPGERLLRQVARLFDVADQPQDRIVYTILEAEHDLPKRRPIAELCPSQQISFGLLGNRHATGWRLDLVMCTAQARHWIGRR